MNVFVVEPELAKIVQVAKGASDKYVAYREAKRKAEKLVGFGAENSELRTTAAYDAFNKALVDAIGL